MHRLFLWCVLKERSFLTSFSSSCLNVHLCLKKLCKDKIKCSTKTLIFLKSAQALAVKNLTLQNQMCISWEQLSR